LGNGKNFKVSGDKIVAIGAAGSEFCWKFLPGIIRTEDLHGMELVLVDTNGEMLSLVERLARRMNHEWNADMRITATTERREALLGARCVLLSVAVDRENSWKKDQELALHFGIAHYAENGGPGAFAHTCRNLALTMPIIRDIEQLAPSAFLINFTNPLARICTAIQRLTDIPWIGICPAIDRAYFLIATILHAELGLELPVDPRLRRENGVIARFQSWHEIARKRYSIKAAGLNHFTWILGVRDRTSGEDLYQHVRKKLLDLPESFEPLTRSLAKVYGLLPATGDDHISEYLPFTSEANSGTWEQFGIQAFDFEFSKERRRRRFQFIRDAADGNGSIDTLKEVYTDRIENILTPLLCGQENFEDAVNIPNRGYISNLPENAVVEVSGTINAETVTGSHVGNLPEAIAALCRTQISINDLNVQAFVRGDRNLVYQLFSIDPMIHDLRVATRLADAYIETYRDILPMFG
jgi:alpha-galactosidase